MIDFNMIEVLFGIFVIIMFMLFLKLFKIRIKYWIVLCSFLWYCWKVFKLCIWFGDFIIGFGIFCWLFIIFGVEWVLDLLLLCFLFWLNDCLCRIFKIFGFWFGFWEGDLLLILLDFVFCKFIICLIGDVIVFDFVLIEYLVIYLSKVILL